MASPPQHPNTTPRPLLRGALAREALGALGDVSRDLLLRRRPPRSEPTLADGEAGVALAHAALDRVFPGRGHREAARRALRHARGDLPTSRGPGFFEGFVGIAWASEALGRRGYASDTTDLHEFTERALHDHLAGDGWRSEPFDLAVGLVGVGVYALERRRHASARRLLALVVQRLHEAARRSAEGVTWAAPSDAADACDLGVVHGVPGVIALLGRVCGVGLCLDAARPLLDGALAWLSARALPAGAAGCFPRDTRPSNANAPARLAWCYGDAGVAAALLVAGRAARVPACVALGTRVALRAASRRPASSGVVDVTMCHGAAGLGHLFHRLHRATGERALGRAARRWLRRCLAMRDDGRFGGFSSLRAGPDDWLLQVSTPGFILGSGGVAMALAAALRGLDDAWWDRCMLLSDDEDPATARSAPGP